MKRVNLNFNIFSKDLNSVTSDLPEVVKGLQFIQEEGFGLMGNLRYYLCCVCRKIYEKEIIKVVYGTEVEPKLKQTKSSENESSYSYLCRDCLENWNKIGA